MNYQQQIKSPKWQKKRLEIMQLHDFTCEICSTKEKELHIHHLRYIKGRKIWEYDNDILMCICKDCHSERHKKYFNPKNEKSVKAKTINNEPIGNISIKELLNKGKCINCIYLERFESFTKNEKIEMFACNYQGILRSTYTNKSNVDTKGVDIENYICEYHKY